ncbi:MAG: TIGR02281 family clan AA aspartic protease [Pseudomonadota bacterium]
MDTDDTMRLVYLALLGTVIAGYFLMANRARMSQMLQQAAIWFFIFVGGVLVFGISDDVSQSAVPRQSVVEDGGTLAIEVPRRFDGHYHLTLAVNGEPVEFIVDTGATDLVLAREDARRVGLDPDELNYLGRAFTANGEVRTASIRLDEVALGQITDRDVRGVVTEGDLQQSLLGMSYLNNFGRIEIEDDTLRLIR